MIISPIFSMINDEQSFLKREIFMKIINFHTEKFFTNGIWMIIISFVFILILMYFLFKNEKPFSIDNKESWKETFLSFGFIFFTFIFVVSTYLVIKSKPVLTIKYVQTSEQNEDPNKDDVINKIINGHVYGEYENGIYKVFEKEFVLSKHEYEQLEERIK
jgi:hypothetical protein